VVRWLGSQPMGKKAASVAFKVFVSYATSDLTLVERIRLLLSDTPIEVFVAEHSIRPGESLQAGITTAIRECDLFLLLWSSSSSDSEWVRQEVGAAHGLAKPVLPLVLDANLKMPAFLEGLKYLVAHDDPDRALAFLRDELSSKAMSKQQQQGFVFVALSAAVLYVLSKK
jgi:hypothetical protein